MAQHASRDGTPRRRSGDALRLQILDAIEAYQRAHGRSPTIREIGVQVGIAAPSHVRYHVTKLEQEGYLTREPASSRSLVSTRSTRLRVLGTIAAGEPLGIVDIGPRNGHRPRHTVTVDHDMALRAQLATVRRILAGLVAPWSGHTRAIK